MKKLDLRNALNDYTAGFRESLAETTQSTSTTVKNNQKKFADTVIKSTRVDAKTGALMEILPKLIKQQEPGYTQATLMKEAVLLLCRERGINPDSVLATLFPES